MSRRKQSKPQQHLGVISGETSKVAGESVQGEPASSILGENDTNENMHLDQQQKDGEMSHSDTSSEVNICGNCQGEFIGTSQFLQHKVTCNKKQVVVIMNEDQKQQEETQIIDDIEAPIMDTVSKMTPPLEEIKEQKVEVPSLPQPIDFSTAQPLGNREKAIPLKELPEKKNVPLSSYEGHVSPSQQTPSDIPSHTNVVKRNGVKSFSSSVAVIQEQLYTLHQQHLQQMQIILQIQEKIQALVAESFHQGVTSLVKETKETIADHLTTVKPPVVSTEASSQVPRTSLSHPIMPSSLELLQTQVRQTSLPFPAFPLPPPHPPFDLFPQPQPGLQPASSPLQVPSPLPYPGGLLSHRKGKPPNVSVFDPKFTDDAFFRHKCHFCHKVFGSDSALQIHIRSHTGERPFKCNICGNRFSTKGNLKVHFQRHQAQYPNVEMDITPYPPSPPLHDQPLQPPTIDQIPMPSIPSESSKVHAGDSALQGQEKEVANPQNSNVTGEINNNEKLSSSLREVQANDTSSKTETSEDDVDVGGRPSSAPSKVLTSSFSPIENEPPTSNSVTETKITEYHNHGVPISSCSSSVLPVTVGDGVKTSETSKLQHLVESIEQKITEPNQCVICHRVLSCKNALQLHYRIHTGERPFKCKICGRTFTTKGNLKTHYGVHRAKPSFPAFHECPICQKNFSNPMVLQQHLKLHAAEDMMMHSSFDSESYFREETQQERRPDNLMESLRARFNYMKDTAANSEGEKQDLTRPLSEPDDVNPKRQKMTSSDANGVVDESGRLNKNMPFQLGLLPTKPGNVPNGDKENSEGSDNFPTSPNPEEPNLMMDESSNGEGALDLTPKVSASSPDSVRSNPQYVSSGSEYPNMMKAEGFESGTSSPDPDMDPKLYGGGEMHPLFDSGIPSFLMGRHKSRSNTTCYFCGKTFACASALNIHYRSHTKERPFKCDVCCKGFSTRGNLKQHMLTHKIRDMPSQLLGMNSPMMSGMIHKSESTSPVSNHSQETNEEPPSTKRPSNRHQCSVCEKQFQSDSALQIHVRTHTGEKPYKCHICSRAFTTKGNMKVHLGTHMWNGGSRRGRRITMDPPMLMNPKDGDLYRNDFFGFRPGFDYPFFHYPPPHPLLNGFNPLSKPNEISVIQNPHSLGGQYPPSSESSLMKNGQSIGEATSNSSYSHIQSSAGSGSGRSSPEKKQYSPLPEGERASASIPPSSQSSASLNYLHLPRTSTGPDSTDRVSPDRTSYRPPVSENNRNGNGLSYPPSSKPTMTKISPVSSESPSLNYLHLVQPGDPKTSRYNTDRSSIYLSGGSDPRLMSPSSKEEGDDMHDNEGAEEDSLISASRMVDQLQAQRV
ncbi:Sal-like protein 3 [Holothuria leucospilota]|uniref:Sal-like protein 3 n=1 Tax=Holothuria leucospilota TaxID=206669 RepID=A0A9Q1CCE5_HOLLE|nr:Sal-like protein 3 [Holothuria leucospilota]